MTILNLMDYFILNIAKKRIFIKTELKKKQMHLLIQ